MKDDLIERLPELLARITPVRPGWALRVKDDGEERYDLIGDPCGFPVATFGDANDAAFDLECRNALPELLADHERQASEIERLTAEIEDLRIHVGRLVSLNDASDLQWNLTRGFADSIDNDKRPYQSSALATAIEHARLALNSIGKD